MKTIIARALLICTLSAILVSGINVAALGEPHGKSNSDPVAITMVQPGSQALVLGNEALQQIVGGATGCHFVDDGASITFGCCVNLWIFEVCFEIRIYY